MDKTFKALDRYGAEIEFELVEPGLSEEREGEMQYRIAFSKALQCGILPREKMREVMRENGVWDEDDDRLMKEALTELASSQAELEIAERADNEEACLKAATKVTNCRNRMWELFMVQQSSFMNSTEGYAETIKGEAIMAATTKVKATGERYWKTYREYIEERDSGGKSTVADEVMKKQDELIVQTRDEMMQDYPERRWLKEAKDRILDSAATEAAESLMEKKQESKSTKKKATRKKTSTRKRAPAKK